MFDWKGFADGKFIICAKSVLASKGFIKEYNENLASNKIDLEKTYRPLKLMQSGNVYFGWNNDTHDMFFRNWNGWEGTKIINWSDYIKEQKEN